ncbi:autophagy-related protein 16-1 [Amia ocellicauda]|uniref:autophagy-related protein 16-1 n=1 Tax=Amia ocellicauda TaxID=2972642 RepID=UPI003464BFB9
MEGWKSHVRAQLCRRDCIQRDAFRGLSSAYARLLERVDLQEALWEEAKAHSPDGSTRSELSQWVASLGEPIQLQLELREGRRAHERLSLKVSDLSSSLVLLEAELQDCHSQVSRYRGEAVSLSRCATALQASLLDLQVELEHQSSLLDALRSDQARLRAELGREQQEKAELLERWLEEKREQAERVNQHNATQERWARLTSRLKKRLRNWTPRHSIQYAGSDGAQEPPGPSGGPGRQANGQTDAAPLPPPAPPPASRPSARPLRQEATEPPRAGPHL